jgi:catechol 2,3-dioxygenase-like lactoylglutathione lyase family enzyme
MILRNHHVLAVHDVRAAARFYVDVLGFELVQEPPGWIFVERKGCMLMLGECPDDLSPARLGCYRYFAYLLADDADGMRASRGRIRRAWARSRTNPGACANLRSPAPAATR